MSAAQALAPAIAAIRAGQIVVMEGDRLRGGDIDFVLSAQHATPETINFMAVNGRGLICLAITSERAVRLGISLVNSGQERQSGRPFGRSIEAREGVTTGISAADRAHTIAVTTRDGASADDIVSPGHVFPLIARAGGVRERPSATEASIDLCRLAGAGDAAVLCSIMRADGEMARIDDLGDFIRDQGLAVARIADLIAVLEGANA